MTVQVLESVRVHEPIIFGVAIGAAAAGDGLSHVCVHLGPAFAGKGDEDFRALGGVADFLGSEFLEFLVGQQHGVDVFADDHASGGFVGELRIEVEAEALEEVDGLAEVFDGQVDEYFGGHVCVGDCDGFSFAEFGRGLG